MSSRSHRSTATEQSGERPLDGIRVLEVAMSGFVPSAGAVLADWGADVIKVEHAVTGDPQRGLRRIGPIAVDGEPNPNVEHANRGKRSVGIDMSLPEGRAAVLAPARGAEADRGGYDMTAYWCRGGVAATLSPPDIDGMIGPPGPAFGDTVSGTNLAGGIAAALVELGRTGRPSVVDVPLLGSGLSVQDALQVPADPQVRANEYVVQSEGLHLVSSPVQFDGTAPALPPGPRFAAHTEEVPRELGWDWNRIIAGKTAGAIT